MTHEIEIAIMSVTVKHDHAPSTYTFTADVAPCEMGGYGLPHCDPGLPTAAVSIDVPDWISLDSMGRMIRPGYNSKAGTAARCLVTCNTPAIEDCEYYGDCDYHALILRALSSGLTLHYPTDDRSMATMPIKGDLIGWRENGSRVLKHI